MSESGQTLPEIIRAHIARNGPLSVEDYMALCLSHPVHGYYMKQDPFGADGDFITAPEISQLFGEMIGAWAADLWMQMGSPARFILLECGPGRGTLMADALRATSGVSGFHAAAQVHLLETSPALKQVQSAALEGHEPHWHSKLESVPDDAPIIALANEFFDALPFKSLQKGAQGWMERVIGQDESGALAWDTAPADQTDLARIPFDIKGAAAGSIYEVSPARKTFMHDLSQRIARQGGAALVIDYGHVRSACGDTFQALRSNRFHDPLAQPGDCDLTSHVDFEALQAAASGALRVAGPVEQGAFLRALGIEVRAQMLMQSGGAGDKERAKLQKDLHRLCASDQMGKLFKVITFYKDEHERIRPCGF